MSRLIEIALFLSPFVAFAIWRLAAPSPTPPGWLVGSFGAFAAIMLLALVWVRFFEAGNRQDSYVPAHLSNGQVMPAQRVPQ
jgi:Family of unknown function (DUF6111)